MIALRAEVDDVQAKNDDLQAKIKVLEQENLQKEQEITSLNHQKNLLEQDVEKLETRLKEEKEAHVIGSNNSQEMQNLQRKVQLLEEEAEEAEKNLRETNEKYVISIVLRTFFSTSSPHPSAMHLHSLNIFPLDCVSPMSRPSTTSVKSLPLKPRGMLSKRSTKMLSKRERRPRMSWRTSRANSRASRPLVILNTRLKQLSCIRFPGHGFDRLARQISWAMHV